MCNKASLPEIDDQQRKRKEIRRSRGARGNLRDMCFELEANRRGESHSRRHFTEPIRVEQSNWVTQLNLPNQTSSRNHRSAGLPGCPIKGTTVQVHHCRDVKVVPSNTVYYSEREPMEVELSILSSNLSPAFWLGQNPPQRAFKLGEKVLTQAGLTLLVPERRGFKLLVRFRMAYDAHGASGGCRGQLALPGGTLPCLLGFRGIGGR